MGPPRTSEVGEWEQEPGSYCLGADDPGVPDIARVLAQMQTAFDNLPLPKFGTQISPAPRTLVNIPTRLSAGSPDAATFSPTLLGIRVTITARPTAWRWTFGDGTTAETSVPMTEHVYLEPERVGASVRVTWTGTFTVGPSAEVFPIRAPAIVQGPVSEVEVVQARAQLVAE
ncbi:MAG: PKD domain-containing protein [Actinomycetota bacterium]|nr:PKD domain-containing protein [Actinomycetota bacterium]